MIPIQSLGENDRTIKSFLDLCHGVVEEPAPLFHDPVPVHSPIVKIFLFNVISKNSEEEEEVGRNGASFINKLNNSPTPPQKGRKKNHF